MSKIHLPPINSYYAALERLIKHNKKISFDAVAMEAGRGRGAIKGNTREVKELKEAIILAKNEQNLNFKKKSSVHKLSEAQRIKENYKTKYEEVLKINDKLLNDLCNVIFELAELKIEMSKILDSKDNIIHFK